MKTTRIDDLYRDGSVYDLIYPGWSAAAPFLQQHLDPADGPALELACGTGNITIPMALAGFAITGVDNAANMLGVAQQKAAAEQVAIDWVLADMRDFDLRRSFAAIYLLANALSHLLTRTDFAACMARVRNHLQPGGRFIVNTFVPSLEILAHGPDERHSFGRYADPHGRGEVVVTYSNVYEVDTQINRVTTYTKQPDTDNEMTGELNLRMYFPQELDALLECNGFRIEQKFGSVHGAPFDANAETQLVVCRMV